jgi:hypothetical protein
MQGHAAPAEAIEQKMVLREKIREAPSGTIGPIHPVWFNG